MSVSAPEDRPTPRPLRPEDVHLRHPLRLTRMRGRRGAGALDAAVVVGLGLAAYAVWWLLDAQTSAVPGWLQRHHWLADAVPGLCVLLALFGLRIAAGRRARHGRSARRLR